MTGRCKRRRPSPRPDEAGVSNVLGAILMFGLLVLTLTIIQVEFVPVWTEDREARHMQALGDDLRQLKSDLTRQAGNDTAASITDSFALGDTGGFRFFQGQGGIGSTATFSPASSSSGLSITSSNLPVQILRRNGQALFGLDPAAWTSYTTADKTDVASVNYLLLRIHITGGPQCGGQDDHSATLSIYDVNNVLIGSVLSSVYDTGSGSDCAVSVKTSDGATPPNELNDDTEFFTQNVGGSANKYYNLLEPERLLGAILAQSTGPFRLSFVQTPGLPLDASYQIAYDVASTGGTSGAGGVLDPAGFSTIQLSGHVVVAAENQRFPDQTYTLEHGAIVLSQDTGSVMAAPPDLSATIGSSQASVIWTLAGLTGDGVTLGSSRVAAQATPTGTVEDVWLLAPSLTMTIPTNYPSAWQTYLQEILTNSGWAASQLSFPGPPSTTSVTLRIEGPTAADPACTSATPAPCVYDVSLRFRLSNIDLSLVPAG